MKNIQSFAEFVNESTILNEDVYVKIIEDNFPCTLDKFIGILKSNPVILGTSKISDFEVNYEMLSKKIGFAADQIYVIPQSKNELGSSLEKSHPFESRNRDIKMKGKSMMFVEFPGEVYLFGVLEMWQGPRVYGYFLVPKQVYDKLPK